MKICPQCLRQFEDDAMSCPHDGTRLRQFHNLESRMLGRVLDERWKVEEKIGEGGMGEIYRGTQVSVDRVVAIKMLRLALASNEEYVSRFFREARIATTINHANLITIYDFGQTKEDQILYLTMEYLEGIPLSEKMKGGALPLPDILKIACQVCAGLSAAHDENIVHRDLKPENVFVVDTPGDDVFIKLLDFGIAKDLGSDAPTTQTGQLFGTPEYMSPEQCQGGAEIDQRSDLYSLGCILYELLSGSSPFRQDTVIKTLLAQVNTEPEPLSNTGVPLPEGVIEIVETLLLKDPGDRYASARDVKTALEAQIRRLERHPEEAGAFTAARRSKRKRRSHTPPRSDVQQAETSRYSSVAEPAEDADIGNASPPDGASARDESRTPGESRRPGATARKTKKRSRRARGRVVAGVALAVLVVGMAVALGVTEIPGEEEEPADLTVPAPPVSPVDPEPAMRSLSPAYQTAEEAALRETVRLFAGRSVDGSIESALARSEAAGKLARTQKKVRRPRPETETPETPDPPEESEALLDVRTPASIDRRSRIFERDLLGCYGLRTDPDAEGNVRFRFRILPDGSVDSARVMESDFTAAAVDDCVVEKVSKWTFAPSQDEKSVDHHERQVTFRMNRK